MTDQKWGPILEGGGGGEAEDSFQNVQSNVAVLLPKAVDSCRPPEISSLGFQTTESRILILITIHLTSFLDPVRNGGFEIQVLVSRLHSSTYSD